MDGKKFDMRVYVVIAGINEDEMHAFVADEGIVRFCTEQYQRPTRENMKHAYMHLTNCSLNKHSEDYRNSAANILEPNDASIRTLAALYAQILNEHGAAAVAELKENIKETCSGTAAMLLNMFQHLSNPHPSSKTTAGAKDAPKPPKLFKGQPFQVLGFDILVDQELKCWVLEINDHPSFNIYICKQPKRIGFKRLDECQHQECPMSEVDRYVKKRIFTDVLDLVVKSRTRPVSEFAGDTFGSLIKIFPSEKQEDTSAYNGLR